MFILYILQDGRDCWIDFIIKYRLVRNLNSLGLTINELTINKHLGNLFADLFIFFLALF